MRVLVHLGRLLIALGGVTLVAAVLAIPALAATGSYSGTSASTVSAGTTSGTPASLSVTLTNTSSSSTTYKLGSANITFPGCSTSPCAGGFVLQQGTAAITATGGANWSAKVVGNVVQIRAPESPSNNRLAPGKSLTVTVKSVAAPTAIGAYALATIAKDDGDYDGTALTSTGTASIVVTPGPLNSFTWTTQPGSTQTAGVPFSAQVTARDAYGNTVTNYNPSGALVTTDASNSPNHTPDLAAVWSGGIGAVTATAYMAEAGRTLKVTDGSVSNASNAFDVAPGALGRFTVGPLGAQTAGVQFQVSATAYDRWGNLKTDYAGVAVLSGGTGAGDAPGTAPDNVSTPQYGSFGSWSGGVSSAPVTLYAKETSRRVSVTDGSVSNGSNAFDVRAGTFAVSFTMQPGNAVVNATIPSTTAGQPITLSAKDTWGNTPDNGSTVGLATSPSVSLSGTNPGTTTAGVAKFTNLSIASPNTYVLSATLTGDGQSVGPVSSASFVVSPSGVSCTAPCTAPSLTETSSGLTSTVAASGSTGTLNVNFLASPGYCGGFTPIGSITNFQVFGGSTPSFDLTWSVKFSNTLNPSLITKTLSSFDICLGTINTQTNSGPGFRVKGGGTATLQADGFYWGLIPSCGDDSPANNPCVYARSKTSTTVNGVTNGTVTVKFRVQYPWDGKYGGG